MAKRKNISECDSECGKKTPSVIVTMNWDEDKWEEAEDRKLYGENIDVEHGVGFIIIKYYDKNPSVKERESDCIEIEDFR